jgi:hypothetical protein
MSRNVRGAYMNFEHDRAADWDFLAKWQPNVVRYMGNGNATDPNSFDVSRVKRIHDTCPEATILLRCWGVDDNNFAAHNAMVVDPHGTAYKQVEWWASVITRAESLGIPRHKLLAGLNNETGPEKDAALFEYTKAALQFATEGRVRLGVLVFSVGRPALEGEAHWDITKFEELDALVIKNGGAVLLHEYMQPEGMYAVWTDDQGNERKDYTYLIGRHTRWAIKSPIIIGEWGIDGILYNRHPDPKYGNSGWRNFKAEWPPSRYADEYVECVRTASRNVIGVCPFLSDFSDHKWQSFDMLDAYGELLARKDLCVKTASEPPIITHLPSVGTGPKPMEDNFERAMAFVKEWEGGYVDHPSDPGGATNKGVTIGTFIRWRTEHGQPTPTKEDLRFLSDEEAYQIYREWYWQASGSDKLPWPLALANFDTAVNAGPGRAKEMLDKSGGNFLSYMGHLIDWYTRIPNFEHFGKAWIRRRADLLLEASK